MSVRAGRDYSPRAVVRASRRPEKPHAVKVDAAPADAGGSPTTSIQKVLATLAIALLLSLGVAAHAVVHAGTGMPDGPLRTLTLAVGRATLRVAAVAHLTWPWDRLAAALGNTPQTAVPPLLASGSGETEPRATAPPPPARPLAMDAPRLPTISPGPPHRWEPGRHPSSRRAAHVVRPVPEPRRTASQTGYMSGPGARRRRPQTTRPAVVLRSVPRATIRRATVVPLQAPKHGRQARTSTPSAVTLPIAFRPVQHQRRGVAAHVPRGPSSGDCGDTRDMAAARPPAWHGCNAGKGRPTAGARLAHVPSGARRARRLPPMTAACSRPGAPRATCIRPSSARQPRRRARHVVPLHPPLWRPTPRHPLHLLVTGDSLPGYLGPILLDDAAAVGPVRGAVDVHDGTGLTRPDFVDWSLLARQQVATYHPDAVVVWMGGNDFQNMTLSNGQVFLAGTPAWTREYQRRAQICMRLWTQGGARRVYWLSMPPARDPSWAYDDAQIDDALQRAAARLPGVEYLDILGPITDHGRYADYVYQNGQPVLVREADGVHVNFAGSALVAQEVLRVLEREWRFG